MTQLAVEWLYENLLFDPISNEDVYYNENILKQAKEIEKQNIITAYNKSVPFKFGKEYYNETFKK